ncbi:MAG: NusG domain II-containing protein [Eubacteriaceae bacterium]|nr:NusG domain II-containing protein [Eubacteriaceae bacterium]
MLKIIKKADIILIICLIVCGLAATIVLSSGKTGTGTAVITIDGKTFGTYSLLKDRTINTHTGNIIAIKDGYVYMKSATCHGQDCVHQGKIDGASQSIICLPHKLVVEIKGEDNDYDTISK